MPRACCITLSLLVAVGAPLAGCRDKKTSGSGSQTSGTAQPAGNPVFRQYEVRAQIERLPGDNGQLVVRHEAIPSFDGGSAAGAGMNVMSMPFWPPAIGNPDIFDESRVPETLDLEGLKVGDKVMLRFEVQHPAEGASPCGYYATKIEKLPADTELDFDAVLPKTVTFKTRGQVTRLPSITSNFMVHHEAVPDFPNPDGSMGMNSMTMSFWPAGIGAEGGAHRERIPADLDLTGIEVGDKVLITWEYQRDRVTGDHIAWYAVKVEELPADTELDFSPLP